MRNVIRIGGGLGYWGDDTSAPGRLVRDGRIDYLVMDFLAEVTMSILQKQKSRDPAKGYATDVLSCSGVDILRCQPIVRIDAKKAVTGKVIQNVRRDFLVLVLVAGRQCTAMHEHYDGEIICALRLVDV